MKIKRKSTDPKQYIVIVNKNGKTIKYAPDLKCDIEEQIVNDRKILTFDRNKDADISIESMIWNLDGSKFNKEDLFKIFYVFGNSKEPRAVWDLFVKMKGQPVIIRDGQVYKITKDYYLPASYIKKISKEWLYLPEVNIKKEEILKVEVKNVSDAKKFSSLFGEIIENKIAGRLQAKKIYTDEAFVKNNNYLKPIHKKKTKKKSASRKSTPHFFRKGIDNINKEFRKEFPDFYYIEKELETVCGTAKLIYGNKHFGELEDLKTEVSVRKYDRNFSKSIRDIELGMQPIFDKLDEIFKGEKVYQHELVKDKAYGIIAQCDISSKNSILEIKSCPLNNSYDYQIYFEKQDRQAYAIGMDWKGTDVEIYMVHYA